MDEVCTEGGREGGEGGREERGRGRECVAELAE